MGTWHLKLRSEVVPGPVGGKPASLEHLWNSTSPGNQVFDAAQLSGLPEGARLYLQHAIAPGTPLASTVRLRMHGEIKLQAWYPFSAEK